MVEFIFKEGFSTELKEALITYVKEKNIEEDCVLKSNGLSILIQFSDNVCAFSIIRNTL